MFLRRWCTWRLEVEIAPNPRLLCDDRLATDGIWASRRQHPVQHCPADGSFGLLGGEAAGAPSTCRTEVAMAYDESSVLVVTPKRRRR